MEAERVSRRKRKPLGDCTNTVIKSSKSSTSTVITKPTNLSVSSSLKNLLKCTDIKPQAKFEFNAGSTTDNPETLAAAENPTFADPVTPASTQTQQRNSSTISGEIFEPCSVYTRRQITDRRKTKRSTGTNAMSVPLTGKIPGYRGVLNLEASTSRSKSCEMPHRKKQRKLTSEEDDSENALPQDFIEQQKAYFAEIDAYELSEEVTTADELD